MQFDSPSSAPVARAPSTSGSRGTAIVGVVLAFVLPLVGLVVAIIGPTKHEDYRRVYQTAIVLSVVMIVLHTAVTWILVDTIFSLGEGIEELEDAGFRLA